MSHYEGDVDFGIPTGASTKPDIATSKGIDLGYPATETQVGVPRGIADIAPAPSDLAQDQSNAPK